MVDISHDGVEKKVRYSISSDTLTFEWHRSAPLRRALLGILCIVFLGASILFLAIIFIAASNGKASVSIQSAFFSLGFFLSGYSLATFTFNKINIQCDRQKLTVETGPLPFWPKAKSISTRDIKKLYVDEQEYSQSSRNISGGATSATHQITVLTHSATRSFALKYLPSEEAAQFVLEKIKSFLHIEKELADPTTPDYTMPADNKVNRSQMGIPESITVERMADSVRLTHFKKKNLILLPIILPISTLPFFCFFISIYHAINSRFMLALGLLGFAVVSAIFIFISLQDLVNKKVFTISANKITIQNHPITLRRKGKSYNRTDVKQITISHHVRGAGKYLRDFHILAATTHNGKTIRLAKLDVGYKDAPFIKQEIDTFFRLDE